MDEKLLLEETARQLATACGTSFALAWRLTGAEDGDLINCIDESRKALNEIDPRKEFTGKFTYGMARRLLQLSLERCLKRLKEGK